MIIHLHFTYIQTKHNMALPIYETFTYIIIFGWILYQRISHLSTLIFFGSLKYELHTQTLKMRMISDSDRVLQIRVSEVTRDK